MHRILSAGPEHAFLGVTVRRKGDKSKFFVDARRFFVQLCNPDTDNVYPMKQRDAVTNRERGRTP